MLSFKDNIIGEFKNQLNNWYTFSESNNLWGINQGFPHEIDVLDGTRCAHVKKTVAHVAVDEDEKGRAIIEIWPIKKYNLWVKK